MSFSLVVISILIIALICGAGQKVLDKMRMNDKWALAILVSIAVGIIIPPVYIGKNFAFSIGGFLIPFAVCVYLMIRTGLSMDLFRAFIGSVVTAGLILLIQYLMPSKTPEDIVIDNTWLYGIVAGVTAYILGRSRRNAFICSVLGIFLASIIQFVINYNLGALTPLKLGLAGAFDTVILSTLIAVGLSEAMGKTFEAVVGKSPAKAFDFESGEFVDVDYEDRETKMSDDKNKYDITGKYKKPKLDTRCVEVGADDDK